MSIVCSLERMVVLIMTEVDGFGWQAAFSHVPHIRTASKCIQTFHEYLHNASIRAPSQLCTSQYSHKLYVQSCICKSDNIERPGAPVL